MRRSCPQLNSKPDRSLQEFPDNLNDRDVGCNRNAGDEFFDDNASEESNESLYNRCWQRAEHYVQEFIKEQDAAIYDGKDNEQRNNSYLDTNNHSDSEHSQLSPSSSDESKTYSQVYSEILEESKARQKKAEKICRVYNNSNDRTMKWVEQIGQYDEDGCTSEATDHSDKDSKAEIEQSDCELDYEGLIKEQLDIIAQYQNDPLGTLRNYIGDYTTENAENRKDNAHQQMHSTNVSNRSQSCAQHLNSDTVKSKCKVDGDLNRGDNVTEILQFEHCEIYQVKRTDKGSSKFQESPKQSSDYTDGNPESCINQIEDRNAKPTDCNELDTNCSETFLKCTERRYREIPERCESSDELVDEISQSSDSNRLNKSSGTSNYSNKSQHLPTTSSRSCGIHSPLNNSSHSTNNSYVSSKSLTSSISFAGSSKGSASLNIASKSYKDRACSPIKIKSTPRRSKQMVCDDDDAYIEPPELKYLQASITSKDKGIQYPSEDELKDTVTALPRYEMRKPYDLARNKDLNELVLLDMSLSDDEMPMEEKLQSSTSSDHKKENSSRNSSYNSMASADRSSISSYEPSERFYRRTKAIDDDDDDNSLADGDESEPMSYKRHVSRLAERALRACTNYYSERIKLKPDLDQELNKKVQMIYNSEMRFNR